MEINTVKPGPTGQVIKFQPYLHACRYPVVHMLATVTLSYSSSIFYLSRNYSIRWVIKTKKYSIVSKKIYFYFFSIFLIFNQI